jgi:hypothetical protein
MARKVVRSEILDWQTYSDDRDRRRAEILPIKADRRIHVGDSLTFLFENRETILYQIQEMMRAERIVKESNIEHEMHTYNGLIGDRGELGCSLLVEIEDATERRQALEAWLYLPKHLYALLQDGSRIPAGYDPGQVGEDRLSAVQYLKFNTHGQVPVALGCDLPQLVVEQPLTAAQTTALQADLQGDS